MNLPSGKAVKKHLKRHFLLWIVFGLILILAGGYLDGYRVGPGLTVVRVGTLIVAGVPDGTGVYVDQAFRGESKGGDLYAPLVPGTHTVIVDAPKDEPWQTFVAITSNQTTIVWPILVAKEPASTELAGADASNARSIIERNTLPTETAPLAVGCTHIYVSDNRIIAAPGEGCDIPDYLCTDGACAPTIVYAPVEPIRSVLAFPERDDALIVATGEWIYAIAVDPRSPQFFAPVAHGKMPVVAAGKDKSLLVQDGARSYSLSL